MRRSNVLRQIKVPEQELQIEFVRASGAGGQNVNKVNTKAQLRWNVDASQLFTAEEKQHIKQSLSYRLTDKGEILLTSQETRNQLQNKQLVIQRLNRLLARAVSPKVPRIPTRPTRSSQQKRLESKQKRSRLKQQRKVNPWLHQ